MTIMNKRIGLALIIIAIIVGAIAFVDRMNTEKLIANYSNQTGTCYIGDTCLHEQTNTTYVMLSISAAVILIVGIMIIILEQRKPKIVRTKIVKYVEKQPKTSETRPIIQYQDIRDIKPVPSLDGEQKKIYELIVAAGGSALQGELVEKSGINKVTVSRILDKLEMRSLIERRRHGMSNIVVLKKQ